MGPSNALFCNGYRLIPHAAQVVRHAAIRGPLVGRARTAALIVGALCAPRLGHAEDAPDYAATTLSGDWGGARSTLASRGVAAELSYTVDVMGNPAGGGVKRGVTLLDNINVIVTLDGEKLLGARGTTAKLFLHRNDWGAPNQDLVGSAQGLDNIEIGDEDHLLYEAWIQQRFGDRLSVRAGLYDLNSEFYATATSGVFIHPSYGIGVDLSQTGNKGPSIFPLTAVAARAKLQVTETLYVQAAVLDAMPGELRFDEGLLLVAEAGATPTDRSKLALGGWSYTHEFATMMDAGSGVSRGGYALAEHRVFTEHGSEDQGASVFARAGIATGDVNQFDYAWTAGVVYTGLVPGRDAGNLGLAVARAHNGAPYRAAAMMTGQELAPAETQLELTYQDAVTPWLSAQVDGQLVVKPGTDPGVASAVVVGTRISGRF